MTTLRDYWGWERVGRDMARRDWDAEGVQHSGYGEMSVAEVVSPLGYWEGYDSELTILAATDPDVGTGEP